MKTWQERGRCFGTPSLTRHFYSEDGDTQRIMIERYCALCPVAAECLADGIEADRLHGAHGIRGGKTSAERKAFLKEIAEAV